jgi:hypothetical protein
LTFVKPRRTLAGEFMTVRAEVQELLRWISDAAAEREPKPPQSPARDNWEGAAARLKAASEKLQEVKTAIILEDVWSPQLESARDLEREAESLELRARSLARLAPPRTREQIAALKIDELMEEVGDLEEKLVRLRTQRLGLHKEISGLKKRRPRAEPTEPAKSPSDEKDSAAALARSAAGSLRTAQENLFEGVDGPDAVSTAFGKELDLLAERTLRLEQACRHFRSRPKP